MILEICLIELEDQDKPVETLELAELSSCSPDEVDLFQETWQRLEGERRREVIDKLIAQAQDNAKLNFDDIFISCLTDSDAIVRARSIQGLWECEDSSLISVLMKMLAEDQEDIVRVAAVNKLGRLAILAQIRKVHSRHVKNIGDALFKIIDNKEEKVELKCESMHILASLALPGIKDVIDKAYNSSNPKLRVSAIKSMGLNCNRTWLSILLKELNNPEVDMRLEAVKACGELGEDEVIPQLQKIIRGSDVQLQLTALEALAQIGSEESKQALYQCLRHKNERVRKLAGELWKEEDI